MNTPQTPEYQVVAQNTGEQFIVKVIPTRLDDRTGDRTIMDVSDVTLIDGIYFVDFMRGYHAVTATFNSMRYELEII